jgi:hypothetical protein
LEKAIPVFYKGKPDNEKIRNFIEHENINWVPESITLTSTNDDKKSVTLKYTTVNYEDYTALFTLLDPTPVSWQFAVPATSVPEIIKSIQKEYKKEFCYVYGKLPLHIGVVVQNYKSPLYSGLQALRNIRREIKCWDNIKEKYNGKTLTDIQKELFTDRDDSEISNKAEEYYSLYLRNDEKYDYRFYFPPLENPTGLTLIGERKEDDDYCIYPNTIDFEYLDCNTRRNDIYYQRGKRRAGWRNLRPYSWEDWEKFEKFKELFGNESESQLHNLISLFYSLLEDWEDNEKSLCKLAGSAVINTLHLKQMSEDKVKRIASLFGADNRQDIHQKVEIKHIKTFIDIYDFWHNNLKEVQL